ncbi:MAG: hypothetical protein GY786_07100 [Proteobacteria bacterium]|nr:hypothetical protein [Pseudomonadota bacterium]
MFRFDFIVITSVFLLLVQPSIPSAAPAFPGLQKFKQPDGELVKGYLKGDEFFSWREAANGALIIWNPASKYFDYAVVEQEGDEERLVPSGIPFSAKPKEPGNFFMQLFEPDEEIEKATRQDAIRIWKTRRSLRLGTLRRGNSLKK